MLFCPGQYFCFRPVRRTDSSWALSTLSLGSSTKVVLPTGPFFFLSILAPLIVFRVCRHASCRHHLTPYPRKWDANVLDVAGLLRDDSIHYPDRLELWSNFNLCWLAVCQRQKDLVQDLLTSGHQSSQVSLIRRDRMETMGTGLIQLCDQLEQHGLVDYQMGIWEEEILSGELSISFHPLPPF